MTKDAFHDRLLAIVNKLPGAYEDRPWGSVHCKVDGKIFVGWGRMDDGEMSLGLRVPVDEQIDLVEHDPRFSIAKYSGKYGGVDMRIGKSPDWREVERYVVQSYRLVAPKKRLKELDTPGGAVVAASAKSAKPATPKKRASAAPKASAKRAVKPGRKKG